jgi:hypothetical protein
MSLNLALFTLPPQAILSAPENPSLVRKKIIMPKWPSEALAMRHFCSFLRELFEHSWGTLRKSPLARFLMGKNQALTPPEHESEI